MKTGTLFIFSRRKKRKEGSKHPKSLKVVLAMSYRILKVNKLIKKELSEAVLKEFDLPEGTLLTITRVETSPDLSQARVYFSVLPEDKSKTLLKLLSLRVFDLQRYLNSRLEIKKVPKVEFIEDRKAVRAGRIEELLSKIKIRKENDFSEDSS